MSQPTGSARAAASIPMTDPATPDVPPSVRSRVTVGTPALWITSRTWDRGEGDVRDGVALLVQEVQHHAASNSRFERRISRVESDEGRSSAGEWELEFDPATERVVLHTIAQRRGTGVRDYAQLGILSFRTSDAEEGPGRLRVTITIRLEDLRIGDVIDASYTVQSSRRLLAANWWLFQRVPAGRFAYSMSARVPRVRRFRWRSANEVEPAEISAGNELEWAWNFPPGETRSPGMWLQISDVDSWADVAHGLLGAWRLSVSDAGVIQQADDVIASEPTLARRLMRALDFVRREIRADEAPGRAMDATAPARPALALRSRAGNEKDRASLLLQLLQRIGVPAHLIVTSDPSALPLGEMLPAPDVFERVLIEAAGRCYSVSAGESEPFWKTAAEVLGLTLARGTSGLEPLPPFSMEERVEIPAGRTVIPTAKVEVTAPDPEIIPPDPAREDAATLPPEDPAGQEAASKPVVESAPVLEIATGPSASAPAVPTKRKESTAPTPQLEMFFMEEEPVESTSPEEIASAEFTAGEKLRTAAESREGAADEGPPVGAKRKEAKEPEPASEPKPEPPPAPEVSAPKPRVFETENKKVSEATEQSLKEIPAAEEIAPARVRTTEPMRITSRPQSQARAAREGKVASKPPIAAREPARTGRRARERRMRLVQYALAVVGALIVAILWIAVFLKGQ